MKLTRKLLKVIHTLLIKKTYKEKRLYLFDEKQEKKKHLCNLVHSIYFFTLNFYIYIKALRLTVHFERSHVIWIQIKKNRRTRGLTAQADQTKGSATTT